MSSEIDYSQGMLETLRAAFDRSFSLPLSEPEGDGVDVIGLRIGSERLAFRLRDLSGLQALERIVQLPGGPRGLRGIVGMRGSAIAVYDLPVLLGVNGGAPAWIALFRQQEQVAIAFEALEGYWRVPSDAFSPVTHGQEGYHLEMLRVADHTYAVLETSALGKAIERLAAR